MFENMTYEYLMKRMLARVPDSMDKREGSIIYDAIAPAGAELAQIYIELDNILNETFADTASGEYLTLRCNERGINREPATYAVVEGVFTPSTVNVMGLRFNCGDYNYKVTKETDVAGTYQLTCETEGSQPNLAEGQLIPIDYVAGLLTANIASTLIPGEDEETDEALRERYFDSLNNQAYGGNIADYKEKCNAMPGVGGTKVLPVWAGGGTVKLQIISSDYTKPSETLVEEVQEAFDPDLQGQGLGIAPIGHTVTVEGVVHTTINIVTNITYQTGWSWESAGEYIKAAVDEYFLEMATEWSDVDNLIVRISQLETRILDCAGVLDIANTKINGNAANLTLDSNAIPVRGDISGS